jgi:cyclase
MLKRRIIPCLDIRDGRTVKGIQFEDLRDAGDPVALAAHYAATGADELVLLDITATAEGRSAMLALIARVAEAIDIPFTVGGGISSLAQAQAVIAAGADKVSLNSAALENPALLTTVAEKLGVQCTVLAIDTRFEAGEWMVYACGGRKASGKRALDWAKEGVARGAGEILLTSMNADGARSGFSLDITHAIASAVSVPVIASGGAGCKEDFAALLQQTPATGALAASVFHFGQIAMPELKDYLRTQQIPVR